MKIRPVTAMFFHADREMDSHDKLIFVIRNFAKKPLKGGGAFEKKNQIRSIELCSDIFCQTHRFSMPNIKNKDFP